MLLRAWIEMQTRFIGHSRVRWVAAALAAIVIAGTEVGCAASEPPPTSVTMFIGRNAQLVAHGKPPVDYVITSPGNYAVADSANKGVICFGSVQVVNQHLIVDAATSRIMLRSAKDANLQDVLADQIDTSIEYDIYFTAIKSLAKPAVKH